MQNGKPYGLQMATGITAIVLAKMTAPDNMSIIFRITFSPHQNSQYYFSPYNFYIDSLVLLCIAAVRKSRNLLLLLHPDNIFDNTEYKNGN